MLCFMKLFIFRQQISNHILQVIIVSFLYNFRTLFTIIIIVKIIIVVFGSGDSCYTQSQKHSAPPPRVYITLNLHFQIEQLKQKLSLVLFFTTIGICRKLVESSQVVSRKQSKVFLKKSKNSIDLPILRVHII